MFTVLKSGRESEHGLYKGELGWWWVEQGRWEGGWRNGGQARLLWTDLLLCVYNSSRIPLSLFFKPRGRRTNSVALAADTLEKISTISKLILYYKIIKKEYISLCLVS